MTRSFFRRGFLLAIIFLLSLLAAGYLFWQLRQAEPPAPANHLAADKGYGVTIDLTRYDDDAIDHTLPGMQANGLTWLRQPANWADIEPQPGQFNWFHLDRVVAAAAPHFKLILVLQTSPAWARPEGASPTTPPIELRHFGAFARALAGRYGDRVDFYQVWHEPNLSVSWGDKFVDPAAYANLLREAALTIKEADPTAYILTGALAATLEDGPLNLNEMTFLEQLYQAQAQRWFDIVAVQPYGLWTKPLDPPAPDQPNFRRTALVRQVMLAHGDADTPLWATAFGWVALPANWAGQPSPWSYDLPSVQTNRTALAIDHARANWPWLGPMLAARWDAAGLAEDDPARGFALTETPPLLRVFQQAAERERTATVGRYPATHLTGHYSPGWRFAAGRADIPPTEPRLLTLFFEGTRLDLQISRGLYRGYLWVTVDGEAANALPKDGQGRSYVVLYDPLREAAAVTLARHLEPGRHTAVIQAEGGWEQWTIGGWAVSTETDSRPLRFGLGLAALLAIASGGGLGWRLAKNQARTGQLLWAWSEIVVAFYNMLGERAQLTITFGLAMLLYLAPAPLALALLPLLAVSILLRPDLGLALVTFATFFYRIPLRLPLGSFSPVELSLALTLLGFLVRGAVALAAYRVQHTETGNSIFETQNSKLRTRNSKLKFSPASTDWAALALVLLALLSTLLAENFAVALREWRTVIVGSVLFYFLIRLDLNFSPTFHASHTVPQVSNSPHREGAEGMKMRGATPPALRPTGLFSKETSSSTPNSSRVTRHASRLIDAFVAGAALQASLALYLYFFTERSIDAEGVHRALGLGYGSPNNLALALGRAWPILLAAALLPGASRLRRGWYSLGLLVTGLALYLTFSKGALLLGLPAGLLALALLYGLRRGRPNWLKLAGAALGALALGFLAWLPFSQTERFRATFELGEGSTAFFRLKLWQASLSMLADYWPLGVGPDNFLYQYRTRYILPEAWQEPDLNHPHNLLLDFGTRLGVGGVVWLLWLQAAYWRAAWRLYRGRFSPLLLGLMASMVVTLAHGLVDNSFFLVDLAFAFFLNVGLVQNWADRN